MEETKKVKAPSKKAESTKPRQKQVKNAPLSHGVGRRKSSVARVDLRRGSGKIVVNDKDYEIYFDTDVARISTHKPFVVLSSALHYDAHANVNGGGLNSQADAIKLAHLKTFTAVPFLVDYFMEVELNFVSNFEEVARKYAPFTDQTRSELKQEILAINAVIEKLDKNFGASLKSSLVKYGEHVNKSDRSVLEDFLFPFKLHGIND